MTEILSEFGFRRDGRTADQVRNATVRFNCYPNADGSVYWEQGNTKVLCAVYGPHEPRQRGRTLEDRSFVNCLFSTALFSGTEQRKRQRGDRRSHDNERLIENAMESVIVTTLYPRSQIDIYLEILTMDGSTLATCFNAAALAVADAGIALKGMPAAVCVGFSEDQGCIDLCGREENANSPRLTIGALVESESMVLMNLENCMHQDNIEKMLDSAMHGAVQISGLMRTALMSHVRGAFDRVERAFAAPAVVS
ncbi:hypothetical protein QR680_004868 [Steinernema hermaphroditum]|uniref:Putative exosome complex component RRP41 n=1 Tax=Steinernema hermaphroditum TaxID=289476 RepID=A0AA39HR65_9BILA|nr:hypothetical protein QR680_004868 [Steinernema hermaphroditum]